MKLALSSLHTHNHQISYSAYKNGLLAELLCTTTHTSLDQELGVPTVDICLERGGGGGGGRKVLWEGGLLGAGVCVRAEGSCGRWSLPEGWKSH